MNLEIEPFEVLWDADEEEANEPVYPLVAEGTQTLQVKRCEIAQGRGPKSADPQKNPKGLCLKLALEKQRHKWVWADIPLHWRGLIEAVHRACRVEIPTKPADINPEAFLDQFTNVEVGHYVGRNGDGAKVVRWLENNSPPPPALTPAEKTNRRDTPAQKLTKEFADDDIPF